jgi:hypothetical protein
MAVRERLPEFVVRHRFFRPVIGVARIAFEAR